MNTRLLFKTFILLITVACFTSCGEEDIVGCMDATATNYNPEANVDSGNCTFAITGCTDPDATNYNPDATVDSGDCTYAITGCTDPDALNYNPDATVDSGDCMYEGCTDPDAVNYNPNATEDDGSCIYAEDLFIGDYVGQNICGNLPITADQGMFTFSISDDFTGVADVMLTITTSAIAGVVILANIDDRIITFVETEVPYFFDLGNGPIPVTMIINGDGELDTDDITMNGILEIDIVADSGATIVSDECFITAVKQ